MAIFMIGMRRSGSNLLRVMLNEAPGIVAPHPPHVLLRMMPLLPVYGDLARDESFARLVDDACRLVELNPVPWEGVTFNRDAIAHRCRQRSLVAVYGAIYDHAAETWGAHDWLCKSVENIKFLPQIEAGFREPKYIYLYRDGRDVAVSMRKAIIGEKHMYHMAREWAEVQRLALTHRATVPAERFIGVSYEELTTQAEATVRRLCAFLDVPYSPGMLAFHDTKEAKRTAEKSSNLWGNVARPLMTDNTRKFLREASTDDIAIFESVGGDVLDALGYERAVVPQGEEYEFSDADVQRFEEENARLKQAVLGGIDDDERERRERQDALLAEIRNRRKTATA